VTLKGKSVVTDTGTGAGRNQWKKLLQNTSKFIPDYRPSHSGRQAVSPLHSQHCHFFTTHSSCHLCLLHTNLICLIKSEGDEHVSLHLKQNKILCVAVVGYTMFALENGRFDVQCNLKVHDILIRTFTNALFYTPLMFLNKWA